MGSTTRWPQCEDYVQTLTARSLQALGDLKLYQHRLPCFGGSRGSTELDNLRAQAAGVPGNAELIAYLLGRCHR